MLISANELTRLLRDTQHNAAAAAAEPGQPEVVLDEARRDELLVIYRARHSLQAKAGRLQVADDIQRLLDALGEQHDQRVYFCRVSDEDHHHLVFLNSNADAVLAVVVPPRRPNGEVDPGIG